MKSLNKSQLQTFVDVSVSIGTVIFGSVAIPIVFSSGSIILFFFGLAVSVWFWYIGLVISKFIK